MQITAPNLPIAKYVPPMPRFSRDEDVQDLFKSVWRLSAQIQNDPALRLAFRLKRHGYSQAKIDAELAKRKLTGSTAHTQPALDGISAALLNLTREFRANDVDRPTLDRFFATQQRTFPDVDLQFLAKSGLNYYYSADKDPNTTDPAFIDELDRIGNRARVHVTTNASGGLISEDPTSDAIGSALIGAAAGAITAHLSGSKKTAQFTFAGALLGFGLSKIKR